MPSVTELKRKFTDTDPQAWFTLQNPPVWVNHEAEMTVRVLHPFSYDNLEAFDNKLLGDILGEVNRRQAKVRIERRGVPYSDAEVVEIGDGEEKRYVSQDTLELNTELSDFRDHLGRVMTEPFGESSYDDTLEAIKAER